MGRKKEIIVDKDALSARMTATSDKNEYRRLQCLWFRVARPEMTTADIALATGFSRRRVEDLLEAYRRSGDFSFAADRRGGRYHQNLTVAEETNLLDSFRTQAESATLVCAAEIKAAYEKQVGHRVPDSTVSRLLDRHEWRKVAPYERHPKGDPDVRKEFKETFADKVSEALKDANPGGLPVRVMMQDEGRFGRMVRSKRCWAPKGLRPEMPQQQIRQYIYAYAAVSPLDGVMDSLVLPTVNTKMMGLFLNEVGQRHPGEFILMFADKAAWHTTAKLTVPANMKLCALPAYSPQLNPAEHIWEEVREKHFPNYAGKDLDQVKDDLAEALLSLENNPKLVQSLTGFHWILSALSKAS